MMALEKISLIIFWFSALLMCYSYVIYPILLQIFSSGKKKNSICFKRDELLPISILLSVHNEAKVIAAKLESLFNSDYPPDKIEVLIGDDRSDDETRAIIQSLQQKFASVKLIAFSERQGKPNVINDLVKVAKHEIVILTDANILMEPSALYHLAKHFANETIGLVGGNIINIHVTGKGISLQEKTYINRENKIKFLEGLNWGTMIGPFGALYAFRKSSYTEVPSNFVVDDFFICMKILEQHFRAIEEPDAIGYEDVSEDMNLEFARKVRISSGNFQNLRVFLHLLNPLRAVGFCFLSHKVIRWFGPIFLILSAASSALLACGNNFFLSLFLLQMFVFSFMFIDPALSILKLNLPPARYISYFCWMNLALLIGFAKFIRGIDSNIWKPTKRN